MLSITKSMVLNIYNVFLQLFAMVDEERNVSKW